MYICIVMRIPHRGKNIAAQVGSSFQTSKINYGNRWYGRNCGASLPSGRGFASQFRPYFHLGDSGSSCSFGSGSCNSGSGSGNSSGGGSGIAVAAAAAAAAVAAAEAVAAASAASAAVAVMGVRWEVW